MIRHSPSPIQKVVVRPTPSRVRPRQHHENPNRRRFCAGCTRSRSLPPLLYAVAPKPLTIDFPQGILEAQATQHSMVSVGSATIMLLFPMQGEYLCKAYIRSLRTSKPHNPFHQCACAIQGTMFAKKECTPRHSHATRSLEVTARRGEDLQNQVKE